MSVFSSNSQDMELYDDDGRLIYYTYGRSISVLIYRPGVFYVNVNADGPPEYPEYALIIDVQGLF